MVAKIAMTFGGLVVAVLMAGCAQQNTLANVPAPRFNGPTILKPVTPAPTPNLATAHPNSNLKLPTPGVPRDWTPNAAARPWPPGLQ